MMLFILMVSVVGGGVGIFAPLCFCTSDRALSDIKVIKS
jgi:hypothetical protein